MEIGNPIHEGLSEFDLPKHSYSVLHAHPMFSAAVHDFNPIPDLISHALEKEMRCNPTEHPTLVTEPAWNTPANRERMAEIMFEEFQVPAFYVANTGVLNAYAPLSCRYHCSKLTTKYEQALLPGKALLWSSTWASPWPASPQSLTDLSSAKVRGEFLLDLLQGIDLFCVSPCSQALSTLLSQNYCMHTAGTFS
jgi:hypothetical protein